MRHPVSLFTCAAAAAPALAATGLRLSEWLSGLIRRDRRRDGVFFVFSNPFKGLRGEI